MVLEGNRSRERIEDEPDTSGHNQNDAKQNIADDSQGRTPSAMQEDPVRFLFVRRINASVLTMIDTRKGQFATQVVLACPFSTGSCILLPAQQRDYHVARLKMMVPRKRACHVAIGQTGRDAYTDGSRIKRTARCSLGCRIEELE